MEETQQQLLKEPYNPTDPVVVFDPEYNNGAIIKLYDNPDTKGNSSQFSSVSAVKDDAINIPVDNIVENANKLDKNKTIIVYCKSGKRSASAYTTLKGLGFKVYDLGAYESITKFEKGA